MIRAGRVFIMAYKAGNKIRICVCAPTDYKIDRMQKSDEETK